MKKNMLTLLGAVVTTFSLGACSLLNSNKLLSQLSDGYPTDAQGAIAALSDLKNPAQTLSKLGSDYGVTLGQLAGIAYDSPEYKKLSSFNTDFMQEAEHGNKAVQSLMQNFAMDMATETQVFQDDKPSYGYPALPSADAPESAYGSYRDALVKNFEKQALSRLKTYHQSRFQNKFLNISRSRKEVPAMLKTGDKMVNQYVDVIKLLTSNDKICGGQEGVLAKAMCFRKYLNLVAQYPTALTTATSLLQGANVKDVLTPYLSETLLQPMSQFITKYLK